MKTKTDRVWSISQMVIGLASIILIGSGIAGIRLPDAAVRALGAADLIALPCLVWSTVRKLKKR